MMILKNSDIKFSNKSVCDRTGRVFFYKNRIFRSISKSVENKIKDFLNLPLFDELVKQQFIPNTKIASIALEDCDLVLEHEKLQISTPAEWSFSQIKVAAIFLLEFNEFLKKYGYKLYDGHLWNVCFKNGKPIFFDFGSIISVENPDCFNEDFVNTVSLPLILLSKGETLVAKALLSSPSTIYQRTIPQQTIKESKIINLCLKKFFSKIKLKYAFYSSQKLYPLLLNPKFIQKNCTCPNLSATIWGQYQEDFFEAIDNNTVHQRFCRFKKIADLVDLYCPHAVSAIDLAGNQGAMLYYLEKKYPNRFKTLINVDYDEIAIQGSLENLKKRKSSVQSYLVNFMLHKRQDVSNDFKCDIAFALAITHHLLLSQNFYIDVVFNKIKSFTNQYVFIEFMPWGLWGGGQKPEVPDWYTEKWFETYFSKHFKLLYKEDFGQNRYLFIGEKR